MKKLMAIALTIAVIATVLTGCGQSADTTKSNSGTTAPDTSSGVSSGSEAGTSQTATSSAGSETTSESGAESSASGATSEASSTSEQARSFFDDLTLEKTDGSTVKLSDIAKRYTIVVFWATWCNYCIEEMPILAELSKKEDVEIVMLNSGEDSETVKSFAEKSEHNLNFYVDPEGAVAAKYGITGFPTIVFLTEELEAMGYIPGKISAEDFDKIFEIMDEFRRERGDY